MDFVGLLAKAMACNGHQCRWRMGQLRDLAFTKPDKVYEMRQRKPTFHELSLKFVCCSDSSIYVHNSVFIVKIVYPHSSRSSCFSAKLQIAVKTTGNPSAPQQANNNVIHAIWQGVVAIAPAVSRRGENDCGCFSLSDWPWTTDSHLKHPLEP